jgi:hypothetical protein
MQHRGEIVEHAVRQSGMSLSELSRRLGKSRYYLKSYLERSHFTQSRKKMQPQNEAALSKV